MPVIKVTFKEPRMVRRQERVVRIVDSGLEWPWPTWRFDISPLVEDCVGSVTMLVGAIETHRAKNGKDLHDLQRGRRRRSRVRRQQHRLDRVRVECAG